MRTLERLRQEIIDTAQEGYCGSEGPRRRAAEKLAEEFEWAIRRTCFSLSPEQWARVAAWKKEVSVRAIAILEKRYEGVDEDERPIFLTSPMADGTEQAYYGAVGGGFTYTFMPTSLGTICTVKEAYTGEELVLDEDFG